MNKELHDFLVSCGANFTNSFGSEIVRDFGDVKKESAALRNTAALGVLSNVKIFSYSENEGLDFLDTILAGNILKLRYSKVFDTFLADANGNVCAEILAADIDDKILLLAESIDSLALDALKNDEANFADLTETFSVFSVDGPDASKIAESVFGDDIYNLPYMGVEKYTFDDADCFLFRCGASGELGYKFVIKNERALKLLETLKALVESASGTLCGDVSQSAARMESGFFNIFKEGANVKNPLYLGLQWMMDVDKNSFVGSEIILKNRQGGVDKKLLCLKSQDALNVGDAILNSGKKVGEVVAATYSYSLNANIVLGLIDKDFAYAGLDFDNVTSISRPTFVTESLKRTLES